MVDDSQHSSDTLMVVCCSGTCGSSTAPLLGFFDTPFNLLETATLLASDRWMPLAGALLDTFWFLNAEVTLRYLKILKQKQSAVSTCTPKECTYSIC